MIKLFEMFAGYGGASFALKKADIGFDCVGYSEIDKNAIKIYELNHCQGKNYGDCTKIKAEELPDFDLLTGGFPCQDVSLAGDRDLSKGRTNLYKEILRIASIKKPKYLLLENVKGLLSMNTEEGRSLIEQIRTDFAKIGYGVTWNLLNSKDYGIPQSRARVWIICKFGGFDFNEVKWPKKEKLKLSIKDILEEKVDSKYYLSENQIKFITDAMRLKKKYTQINGQIALTQTAWQFESWNGTYVQFDPTNKGYKSQQNRAYSADGVSPTLAGASKVSGDCTPKIFAMRGREDKGQQVEINCEGIDNSLTSVQKDNYVMHNLQPRTGDPNKGGTGHLTKEDGTAYCLDTGNAQALSLGMMFRKLTPREAFRLQGFLDDEIEFGDISNSALYKLAGNGWCLHPVIEIFQEMFKGK